MRRATRRYRVPQPRRSSDPLPAALCEPDPDTRMAPNCGKGPTMSATDLTATDLAMIRDLRQNIHAHPELGFQETRTSDLIASTLTTWGIPVHRGLGRTGVVGILKNGASARSVGLRADIDALPI